MFRNLKIAAVLAALLMLAVPIHAQNPSGIAGSVPTQAGSPAYSLTAISSTAAVNNQVTLTIPAPTASGYYNYICYLGYNASQDGTATAQTNAVTTSTNFNAFALKYSLTATATINYARDFYWGNPATGCVKSAAPTTSTTFVSPAAGANIAFTWQATYYQAP
jgi:hypothetical protein